MKFQFFWKCIVSSSVYESKVIFLRVKVMLCCTVECTLVHGMKMLQLNSTLIGQVNNSIGGGAIFQENFKSPVNWFISIHFFAQAFLSVEKSFLFLTPSLGITNFDLLGEFGRFDSLHNVYLVISYNFLFGVATYYCILNKFTSTVRDTILQRVRVYVETVRTSKTRLRAHLEQTRPPNGVTVKTVQNVG